MVEAEKIDFMLLLVVLGVTLLLLILVFIVIFVCVIRKQKSRESSEQMERGKIEERKRFLSHRNISFVDDSGRNPGLSE